MACTVVFIDADNQPPALAAPLAKFLASMGREASRVVVAGNSAGDRVRGWEQAILTALPGTDVQCHVAPLRKQSADVLLMFELAPFYHRAPDPSVLILVLSRDDLLLAATECLVAKGHNAMIAVGGAMNGMRRGADRQTPDTRRPRRHISPITTQRPARKVNEHWHRAPACGRSLGETPRHWSMPGPALAYGLQGNAGHLSAPAGDRQPRG